MFCLPSLVPTTERSNGRTVELSNGRLVDCFLFYRKYKKKYIVFFHRDSSLFRGILGSSDDPTRRRPTDQRTERRPARPGRPGPSRPPSRSIGRSVDRRSGPESGGKKNTTFLGNGFTMRNKKSCFFYPLSFRRPNGRTVERSTGRLFPIL